MRDFMDEEAEIQEIRRRKIEEIRRQQQYAADAEQQRAALEAQQQMVLRQILSPEARERLARVKIAHPDTGYEVEQQLIKLAQSGRLAKMIDDEMLQQILARLIPQRREIKIVRR